MNSLTTCRTLIRTERKARKKRKLTLIQLLLIQLPNLIDSRRIPLSDAFTRLDRPANDAHPGYGIDSRLGLHADDADAGVRGPAVVDAIAQIAQPGLQSGGVVLVDGALVGEDGGGAGHGGPGPGRRLEEGHVRLGRVHGEIHRLAREEVRVEDQVDSAVFLEKNQPAPSPKCQDMRVHTQIK